MSGLAPLSPLFAAGVFGSMAMLAWASVAIVPLLIHLWNRRKHRETNWAAMEFLQAAIQEQSKRIRIEQLLLLFLRIAIPIVLALALADPLWQLLPSQGSSLGSRVPHHHVFLVDSSYSMNYLAEGETRFSQAQQFVREVIEKSPQGDGFTLLRLSDPTEAVVASPAYAKADILAEINSLETRDYPADLVSGLELAKRTLESTRTSHPRLGRQRSYLVSDMAKNTWRAVEQPSLRSTIGEIESLSQIVVADVGVEQSENAAIVSAKRTSSLPIVGNTLRWNVSAKSWSNDGACEIEMRVDGRLTEKKIVELPSGQTATASFAYQFDSSGPHVVSFHLPDDDLTVDNQRYEVITIRDSVRVLCVEGRAGAARNVALALAPSDTSTVQIQTVRDHRIGNLELDNYDAIFLCNIGIITAQQAARYRDFLQLGRSVVMFLGDQTRPENHNELLGGDHNDRASVLPGELLSVAPHSRYSFSPSDYQHPLIEVFRGQEQTGLLSTPIWSYMRLKLDENSAARVALEFDTGDPAIIEHSVLGGKFAVVTTAPSQLSVLPNGGRSTPWNAWSVWPSFPPIVQELLAYAIDGQDRPNNVVVGQSLVGSIPINSTLDFVTIRDNRQNEQRVAVQDTDSSLSWSFDNTHNHGVYTATVAAAGVTELFAANIKDYRESEPGRVVISDLPIQFQQNSIDVSESNADATLDSAPLYRQMLSLLLILLITETVVAWYFGNARA